jgi:hypothetical protein
MTPLTAATLFWYRLASTGPNASYAQNERDPFRRQCNLESFEKIKHQMSVVHCGNSADATPYLADYSAF